MDENAWISDLLLVRSIRKRCRLQLTVLGHSSFPGAETQNTKKIDCPKTFKLDGSVHAHFNKNLELNAKATCELWRRQTFTANFALMCSTSVNDHSNLLFWSDVTISHSLPSQIYDFTCMLFHHLWFGFEQHKNDGVQPFWTLNKLNKAKNQLELKNPTEWHLGTEIISHPHFQKWRVEF